MSVISGPMMERLLCERWAREHPVKARVRHLTRAVARAVRAASRWFAADEERVRWLAWSLALVVYVLAIAWWQGRGR